MKDIQEEKDIFPRSRYLIIGALGGFIATEVDNVIKTTINLPIFSFIFVVIIGIIAITDYLNYKSKK